MPCDNLPDTLSHLYITLLIIRVSDCVVLIDVWLHVHAHVVLINEVLGVLLRLEHLDPPQVLPVHVLSVLVVVVQQLVVVTRLLRLVMVVMVLSTNVAIAHDSLVVLVRL